MPAGPDVNMQDEPQACVIAINRALSSTKIYERYSIAQMLYVRACAHERLGQQ